MTAPLVITPLPPEAVTTADVAALLRARTKDLTGTEVGDFTPNTRPTDDEVVRLIAMAWAEVTGQSGASLADRCAGIARSLIAIRAAMWVELSYFPEQVRSDRSVYQELADQYTAGLPTLTSCVDQNLAGDAGGSGGYRFGSLDVHGWTSVADPYGLPADGT
jgi:hypothetical protein